MDCESAREAISARIDGELAPEQGPTLDSHLRGCGECRAWTSRAHTLTRQYRLGPAQPVPSPGERVFETVRIRARPRWQREGVLLRLSLVAVAALQCAVTLPALVLGSDHGAPIHVAHEMGSFDMALAIGFVIAAWRPSRAQGMSALVGAVALLLFATAAIDLAASRTSASDESPHLLAVIGWLLLRQLGALTPPSSESSSISPGALLRWIAQPRSRSAPLAVALTDPDERDAAAEVAAAGGEEQDERRRAASG